MTDTITSQPLDFPTDRVATPLREGRLVIRPSFVEGAFDSHAVDCPFVFSVEGRQGMTYVGWDGIGYQTALAWNDGGDWTPGEVVFTRDPSDPLRQYNAALTSIVRDNDLASAGELRRIDGWYYGTFHAYPGAGYETGPASVGFARSRDLSSWERVGGVLSPEDGGAWERGGLYKSWLMEHDGLFYVFYNAKDVDDYGSVVVPPPWIEQTGLAVSRDLVTWERHSGNPVLSAGGPGAFDERFASDPCVLPRRRLLGDVLLRPRCRRTCARGLRDESRPSHLGEVRRDPARRRRCRLDRLVAHAQAGRDHLERAPRALLHGGALQEPRAGVGLRAAGDARHRPRHEPRLSASAFATSVDRRRPVDQLLRVVGHRVRPVARRTLVAGGLRPRRDHDRLGLDMLARGPSTAGGRSC